MILPAARDAGIDIDDLIRWVHYRVPEKEWSADGRRWSFTTQARSPFEAVRNAWEWYRGPACRGPRPTRDTVFELTTPPAGSFRVKAATALDRTPAQAALFPARGEPFDPGSTANTWISEELTLGFLKK